MNPYDLLLIGGPTGSGKSELACALAKKIDTEIVSVDSMAVYKHMDIGTAKQKNCGVKQHLVDILEPGEYFDAKIFEELAIKAIEDIKSRGKVPILCGGTYLYFQVLLYGLAYTPDPDWSLRKRLYYVAEKKVVHTFTKSLKQLIHFMQKKSILRIQEELSGRWRCSFRRANPFPTFTDGKVQGLVFLGFT